MHVATTKDDGVVRVAGAVPFRADILVGGGRFLDGDFLTKYAVKDSKKWLSTLLNHLTQFRNKIYASDKLISTENDHFEAL